MLPASILPKHVPSLLFLCPRPNAAFSGPPPPPPPGLQQPHHSPVPPPPAHMNFTPLPGDGWSMPPPRFMGGGRAPEPRPMSFLNPPPSAFDLNHQSSREAPPGFRSHSDPQHSQPKGSCVKGEWSRGVAQTDKFPFRNGVVSFRPDGSHHFQGSQVLSDLAIHQQVKRMKTAPQK